MLGERNTKSLQDVLALLYYVDKNGPVTRPQIAEFLTTQRAVVPPPTVTGVSRQLAVLKKCFGVRFHSTPKAGIELTNWGVFSAMKFRRHMKKAAEEQSQDG